MTKIAEKQSSKAKPVAFITLVEDKSTCRLAVRELSEIFESDRTIHLAGADHLRFYEHQIGEVNVLIAMFDLMGGAWSSHAVQAWEQLIDSPPFKESFVALHRATKPHPRANSESSPWVQAETICEINTNHIPDPRAKRSWHSAVSCLKIEKEAEYRLLHQNVWAGVIDALGESKITRFDIFLIELEGNQPYLYYQSEYTGTDYARDMRAQSKSLINQRWWKFTDACQEPMEDAETDSRWAEITQL